MISWTSITHEHVIKGIDLTGCDVYASYKQGTTTVTAKADSVVYDGTDTKVTVTLKQRLTGLFSAGEILVQVNWIDSSGARNAVRMKPIEVDGNLLPRVIEYVGD